MADPRELLLEDGRSQDFDWGTIEWLSNGEIHPGAELTFGKVRIEPGRSNPVHSHPNCEEILYVVSGACEHSCDGKWVAMEAGDSIRVPRGVRHNAINKGDELVHMLVCYSAPDRETVAHG